MTQLEVEKPRLTARLMELSALLRPRPVTGRFWLDTLWLVILCAVQMTIIPSLSQGHLYLDLITPWLIFAFVILPLPKAALTGVIAALLLETHSAAPAGLYITAYWVLCVALHSIRGSISWRLGFPWVVTFATAELWIIAFETLVHAASDDLSFLTPQGAVAVATRTLAAVGFGMLARHGSHTFEEAEAP